MVLSVGPLSDPGRRSRRGEAQPATGCCFVGPDPPPSYLHTCSNVLLYLVPSTISSFLSFQMRDFTSGVFSLSI